MAAIPKELPAHITRLHVQRGVEMRACVRADIRRGLTLDQSTDALARFLGIESEAVRLGIAIANEYGLEVL